MKGFLLFLAIIPLWSCQVIRPPVEGTKDKAMVSNALFYNGGGDYQDSTFRYSFRSYDNKQGSGLYSSYTEIDPGEYKFSFRCVRQPANGESYPTSMQAIESGKCYIPSYKKTPEYRGIACKSDAASKFTQYGSSCGVGGSIPFFSGGCGVELREIPCEAFAKLKRTNTPNEVSEILRSTHNK